MSSETVSEHPDSSVPFSTNHKKKKKKKKSKKKNNSLNPALELAASGAVGSSTPIDLAPVSPSQNYQLGLCLGRGATAVVYKAIDLRRGHLVAVKQIDLAILSKSQLLSLTQESALISSFDHPNIVRVFETIQTENHLNFILE